MNLTLDVWRAEEPRRDAGPLRAYEAPDISEHMSFLEMLDVVNERLVEKGEEPIAFDSRLPRGHLRHVRLRHQRRGRTARCGNATVCQLHMRHFKDGDVLPLEPWRAAAFPVAQGPHGRPRRLRPDHRGGRLRLGPHRQRARGERDPVPEGDADLAMDAAACIGCGACVAACPNASAMLFTSRQGRAPRLPAAGPARARAAASLAMVDQMDAEGFGSCTNHGECEAVCPKEIRSSSSRG